jgi:hypothetical protein
MPRSRSSPIPEKQPGIPMDTHNPLTEIESADASQMVDSSSADLLAELNEKRKKIRLWPFVTVGSSVLVLWALAASWPVWAVLLLITLAGPGTFLVVRRDQFAKTTVLFYDFDEDMEKAYELLHDQASTLAGCARVWQIEAAGHVRDRKYHAGASQLICRKPTSIRQTELPHVKTNISTVAVGVGRQTLHFLPDRILVYDSHGIGAVAYAELRLAPGRTRFIEDGSVPSDAKVVDYTWQYVNKTGGPDRRFKHNRRLPVCLYDELSLRSDSGLNELIQLSKPDVVDRFVQAVNRLAERLKQAQQAT